MNINNLGQNNEKEIHKEADHRSDYLLGEVIEEAR